MILNSNNKKEAQKFFSKIINIGIRFKLQKKTNQKK
jgi:hypothetical protein